MNQNPQSASLFNRTGAWLSMSGVNASPTRSGRRWLFAIGGLIFLIALSVRLLHWQDYQLYIGTDYAGLVNRYKQQAQRMLDGDGILYPTGYQERSSIQLIVHPPGYSIFLAGIFKVFGQSDNNVVLVQIISDSAAAVLVFVIAVQLLPLAASVLAGLLIAFSPHLSHQSLMLLPDSTAVLPILIAVLLLIRAHLRPRLSVIIAAGAMIGVSCWLRSNALLMTIFFALVFPFLFERGRRLKYSVALVLATIAVIAPITIRNWIVFGRFIPLSLGSGITLVVGIADYDKEKRFGMPATDGEAPQKDVEWHNRPDYAGGLWRPDGIERDRYRFARGLEVIRQNPIWFASVMAQRAGSMLRYNDSLSQGWPANSALMPVISLETPFGHKLSSTDEAKPVWSNSAAELLAQGRVVDRQSQCALAEDSQTLVVVGDDSGFDDQFASAPIAVAVNTDYVLKVPIELIEGQAAIKVTSVDMRIALASRVLLPPESELTNDKNSAKVDGDDNEQPVTRASPVQNSEKPNVLLPFATGEREQVLLVVSNNGTSQGRPKTMLGGTQLFELGHTPLQWTRAVRPGVRGIERNIYQTFRVLPLIVVAIIVLVSFRRWRVLLILSLVPAYYLLLQSMLHTEYRYILAIHYFLLTLAGLTLSLAGYVMGQAVNTVIGRLRLR